jgi:hypothetical protein
LYETKCKSVSGQLVTEATSSGLSHTLSDFYPFAKGNMKTSTPNFYQTTDSVIELNFGNIIVNKTGGVDI